MDLTHSLPSIISNIITDYLPPIGFKHAPSPALDYAQLPQREQDVALLERAQAEAKSSSDDDLTIPRNEGINTDRISIGPFGESVPNPGSDEQDIHRVQFYASNNALKVPLVSPIFDRKHLRGLPPLLLVSELIIFVMKNKAFYFYFLLYSNVAQQKDYVMNLYMPP